MPERTCIGCRQKRDQRDLVRFALSKPGWSISRTAPGRGAYVCPSEECINLALGKGRVAHALKASLELTDLAGLKEKLIDVLLTAKAAGQLQLKTEVRQLH